MITSTLLPVTHKRPDHVTSFFKLFQISKRVLILLAMAGACLMFNHRLSAQVESIELASQGMFARNFVTTNDGNTLVYIGGTSSQSNLIAVSLSDGSSQQLNPTITAGRGVRDFAISPDGTKVVYTLATEAISTNSNELLIVPIGGGSPVTLLSSQIDIGDVQFTTDGNTIIYQKGKISDLPEGMILSHDLFSIPAVGGTPLQISDPLPEASRVYNFTVSPAGNRVIYLAGETNTATSEMYSVPTAGGTVVKLGPDTGYTLSSTNPATLSPDGNHVLFMAGNSQGRRLFSVPITGGSAVDISSSLVAGRSVALFKISPDNNNVVYSADQNTQFTDELFSVPITGGSAVQLNSPLISGDIFDFEFTDDGSKVIYLAAQNTSNIDELFAVPVTGGSPVILNTPTTTDQVIGFDISEDPSLVVYMTRNQVFQVSNDGATSPTELTSGLVTNTFLNDLHLSPDGSNVAFIRNTGNARNQQVVFISVATGSMTNTEIFSVRAFDEFDFPQFFNPILDLQFLNNNTSFFNTTQGDFLTSSFLLQFSSGISSATLDSPTQITITFNDNVQTNGSNPTDFTVTDGIGNTFVVGAQVDGTAGDAEIVLTVADVTTAIGDLTITYTNNNDEISILTTGDPVGTDAIGAIIDADMVAPTLVSATKDSDTQITLTFSEPVQTNGTNPADFTVRDIDNTFFTVNAQADGTAEDTEIVLTVADFSSAFGDLIVDYSNNNNEISDFGENDLANSSVIISQGTPPVFENTTPVVTDVNRTGFSLEVDINEAGTIYFVVVGDGAPAPSITEILNGQASGAIAAIANGNQLVDSGDFTQNFSVADLAENTAFDVYILARNATGNIQLAPVQLDITTTNALPVFISSPVISVSNDEVYSYTIDIEDLDNDIVGIKSANLPAFLSLVTAENAGQVSTLAGTGSFGNVDNADPLLAQFFAPSDITVDQEDNLYISDQLNHTIRRIDAQTREVTTIAGNGSSGLLDSTDPLLAQFNFPSGLAVDAAGNIFVADQQNHRIRKIDGQTGEVTTFAGSGTSGNVDNTNPLLAQFANPTEVEIDERGNIFVSSSFGWVIRRIDGQTGEVTTYAGSTFGFNDSTDPLQAQFTNIEDIEIDGEGNMFIADRSNQRIRKIDGQTREVTTFAGSGTGAVLDNEDPLQAQFGAPSNLTLDALGNVFVMGVFNAVRRIDGQTGKVSTIAGAAGVNGFVVSEDPLQARFGVITGMTVDGAGILYLTESGDNTIRQIGPGGYTLTGDATDQDGNYPITLNASDGNGGSAQQTFILTVTDLTPPVLLSGEQSDVSEITVRLSEPVQTNGTNPTDFTLTDAFGTEIVISQQTDGTTGDSLIVLTVPNLPSAVGDPKLTYSNNNGEISDLVNNPLATDLTGIVIDLDIEAPVITAVVKDSETQITLTFSEPVQTNENPTDFSIRDAEGTSFAVSAQLDGVAQDDMIILTVSDLSMAFGDLVISYANNNNEISDFGGNVLANSAVVLSQGTPPIFENTTPAVTDLNRFGFTLQVDIDEAGTVYFVIVEDGANAPTITEILNGRAADGIDPLAAGNQLVDAGDFIHDFNVTELRPNTELDIYILATNTSGNIQEAPVQLDIITANALPVFISSPVISVGNNEVYNYTIDIEDLDNDIVGISSANLPAFLSLVTADNSGQVSTLAGTGSSGNVDDADPLLAQFLGSSDITVDQENNLFITDQRNHTIRRIDAQTREVTTIAGNGSSGLLDSTDPLLAQFDFPSGLAVDAAGNIFVADQSNHIIRRIDGQTREVTTFAGSGTSGNVDNTNPLLAQFANPTEVEIDEQGNIFVSSSFGWVIRRIDGQTGEVTTYAGSTFGFNDSTDPLQAQFTNIEDMEIDGEGNMFIADRSNQRIRKIDGQTREVTTFAGSGTGAVLDNEDPLQAQFRAPSNLTLDALGNVFVMGFSNAVRRIDGQTGRVSTIAGTAGVNGLVVSSDPLQARFSFITGMTVDDAGIIYLTEGGDNTIRQIGPGGYTLTGDATDQDGNYPITLNASDGNGGSAQQTFRLSVVDLIPPTLVSAVKDSDTQITVALSEPVQTNGGNPTDFMVTDALGTNFVVTTQADGTAGDTDIILTVSDLSNAVGDLTVTYTNNNNEIRDLSDNPLARDATGLMIDTDIIAPTMASAVKDSDTQITLTLSEPIQTNGGNPTDFTIVDDNNTPFAVSAQTDGTAEDNQIVLTVADLNTAVTQLTITYTNNNNEITDFGGNTMASDATGVEILLDVIPPDVTLSTMANDPNSGAFDITATFTEDVMNVAIGDFNVTNGTATAISGSGAVYTITITPTADGTVTVNLPANTVQDLANNNNTASNQISLVNDETAPTVTITSMAVDAVNAPFDITITFSEAVTGFDVSDIMVGNGVAGNFAGSADTYTATITPSADGTVTVDIGSGAAQDAATNGNTAATQFSIENDETDPIVTISTAANDPTSGAFNITITFSEDVTGFDLADLTVGNGVAGNFAGSGDTYTATITPAADGTVTIDMAAGMAQDAAGNDNTAATQFSMENDETDPTVVISTMANDPINVPFDITLTFSEDVNGIALADLVITNGSASNLTGSGAVYTATITPTADGTLTVDLGAASAQDAAGNDNTAAIQFNIQADLTAPAAPVLSGISDDTGSDNADQVTNDNTLMFTGTAEANSIVEVFIDGNSIGTTTADGSGSWTFDHSGTSLADTDYSVTATATDAATNTSTLSTALAFTVDTTAPAKAVLGNISTDTGISSTDIITNDGTLIYFGTAEPFSSVALKSGPFTLATATADANGDWVGDVTFRNFTSSLTVFMVTTDVAGNVSANSDNYLITIDTIIPTVQSIVRADPNPTTASSVDYTVTFNEEVHGLSTSSFSLVLTGTQNASIASLSASSGTGITVTVDNITGSGTFGLNLSDLTGVTDIAGNGLGATFTGEVYNTNFFPTDITLSAGSILENNAIGDVVATLSTTDNDAGDSHTYALVSGTGDTDNASFTIAGDELKAAESFDLETKASYDIRLQTDDGRGGIFEKAVTITIDNVPEADLRITGNNDIPATPLGITTTFDITIHNDGDATLTVSSILYPTAFGGPVSGINVPPNSSQVVTMDFTPTVAQLYTGDITIITNGGTGILSVSADGAIITAIDDDLLKAAAIKLYPNPATNIVTIDLSRYSGRALNIQLYDMSGIKTFGINQYKEAILKLDVTQYHNGLYLVQFTDGKSTVQKKIMIRK